jgi:hypothetical protein
MNIRVRQPQKRLTMVSQLLAKVRKWRMQARADARMKKYLTSGRKPWTEGYTEYKEMALRGFSIRQV